MGTIGKRKAFGDVVGGRQGGFLRQRGKEGGTGKKAKRQTGKQAK